MGQMRNTNLNSSLAVYLTKKIKHWANHVHIQIGCHERRDIEIGSHDGISG